jgi:hypothetical protein
MATLKVKIQEDIILDNQNYGSRRTLEIASIDEFEKRIVTCPASTATTLIAFADAITGTSVKIDTQDTKYIRITNLDSSNSIEISVIGENSNYQVRLDAGNSHILGSAEALMLSEEDTSPSFGTMEDLTKIGAYPGGNAVSLEVVVASA